jgi:addiction module RelE/StbE family toxin
MGFKVILTRLAEQDLQEIFEYISRNNPAAAERATREIVARIERIANFPRSGRIIPELNRENLREIRYKSYRVAYRIVDSAHLIEVARIWHSARGSIPFIDWIS